MIPFPDKKYGIIYADPPWGYANRATRAAASKHYPTMTLEEMKKMPVGVAGLPVQNHRLPVGEAKPQRRRVLHGPRKLDEVEL